MKIARFLLKSMIIELSLCRAFPKCFKSLTNGKGNLFNKIGVISLQLILSLEKIRHLVLHFSIRIFVLSFSLVWSWNRYTQFKVNLRSKCDVCLIHNILKDAEIYQHFLKIQILTLPKKTGISI